MTPPTTGTAREAGSDVEIDVVRVAPFGDRPHLGDGEAERDRRVIRAGLRCAYRRHVRIANRLDLLDPVLEGESIEAAEQIVEERDDARRIGSLGPRREADDVREHDGRLRVRLGDPFFAVPKACRDRGRDRRS